MAVDNKAASNFFFIRFYPPKNLGTVLKYPFAYNKILIVNSKYI